MRQFRQIWPVLFLAGATAIPGNAWNGEEHIEIGADAYHRACVGLRAKYSADSDSGVKERLDLACRALPSYLLVNRHLSPIFTYESLVGEWCALAADHTKSPEQLRSIQLGDTAIDNALFTRLAVTNYRHFHPASVTSWRDEHQKSLEAAVSAAHKSGIATMNAFEDALAIQTFAQHYLHDSFASGHMGFNRVASSNAATLTYHNAASAAGRCVANENGDVWFTYGDDHLSDDSGGSQVKASATTSFSDFLTAFITGNANPLGWQAVWTTFPAYLNDSAARTQCRPGISFDSLRSISNPAQEFLTFEILMVTDASIYRPSARGIMLGASRDFVFTFPIGYRVVQSRIFGAVGTTVTQIGPQALLLDYGYVWQVGTSASGALTHEIGFAQFLYNPRGHGYYYESDRVLYALNIEGGRAYLRLELAAARSSGRWGTHVSTAIGFVRRAGKS